MAADTPRPIKHHWYTPEECAAMLGGTPHGSRFRARCPIHGGDNKIALGIAQGRDREGNPMTLLHCFAHDCAIEDICAAMGIEVKDLFVIHPTYARGNRQALRTRSPRIERLKAMPEPAPDDIAQIMLEEMIISDPEWIQTCTPARAKMWELAQASPRVRALFNHALRTAKLRPAEFWETLAHEQGASS